MHSKEFQSLTARVLDFIDKGYDSLTDVFTNRPTELASTLIERGLPLISTDVSDITTELVSVVTSDLEFIGYLKGRMAEAQMEWEYEGTSETAYKFLYYYNLLFNEVYYKLLDEREVDWQDAIERYSKRDIEDVALLFGDGLEMYYDKRKEKWVVCTPSGDLVSIYYEREGENIV